MGEQLYPVRFSHEGSPQLLENLGVSQAGVEAITNPVRLTAVFFASGEEEAEDLVEVSVAG